MAASPSVPVTAITLFGSSSLLLASCGNPFLADEQPEQPAGEAEQETNHEEAAEQEENDVESSSSEEEQSTDSQVTDEQLQIPQEWISDTSQQWPDSEGFNSGAPVVSMGDECLLFDQLPVIFGEDPRESMTGFGSWGSPSINYGNEPGAEDSYRYLCTLSRSDESREADGPSWSAKTQLMVTEDAAHAEETVENFLNTEDLPERVHQIETIEIDGAEIHTQQIELPTNENNGGSLIALFYDQEATALFHFEVNSMDEEHRAEHGNQGVAEDLVRIVSEG